MHAAFIWDLDGTLLDSYGTIVPSLKETYGESGIILDEEEIHRQIIAASVGTYIRQMAEVTGISSDKVQRRFTELRKQREGELRLMPHVREILVILKEHGAQHFIYTHNNRATNTILARLGVADSFDETVTSEYGFARKPAPDGINYLIEKYGLDREKTYYIGDRTIDMDCAKNAGIRGILYLPAGSCCSPNGSEDCTVSDLLDIDELGLC